MIFLYIYIQVKESELKYMKCLCCEKKMKYKDKGYWGTSFSTGPEPDYPDWIRKDVYSCKDCDIKKVNDKWKIPKKYARPTEKQIKTIEFINHYLGSDYEPILKTQCWKIINKHLQEAIQCKETHDIQMAEDMREWYGEWDYF